MLCYRPCVYQATKKKLRLEKKLQEEHAVKSMDHLESAIEQQNYTEEQLDALIEKKKQEYLEFVEKSVTPKGTLLALSATLLPLAGMCGGLYGMYHYQYLAQYIPMLYLATIKYAGLNACL